MKKNFIISSVLALGMGIAQAQTMPQTQPAPMQSGAGDSTQRGAGQTQIPPAAAQAPGTPASTDAAAQTFKGCVNGSPGSWNLISDKGKSLTLSGTDDQLSQYKGQEVRIHGVQVNDGSVTVSSVDQISGSCPNQTASSSTTQSDLSSQSATSTQPPSAENQAPATSTNTDTSNQSSSTTATTTPGANTPPVTNETPANTVGNGQTGQNSAGSIAGNSASTSTEQNANNQGIKQYSDMDQNTGQKLPQTASPLPLLGLLGLGSLAAGLISRRRK